MKVSIIIPFYNGETFCRKIFEKILKQTYKNYEVICVDDGSTDNTLSILKEIEKENKKIKVYSQKNTGPGFARKLGFEKSSGDIILFCDSDDELYDENTLRKIINIFEKCNPDIIFYNYLIKSNKTEICSIRNFHKNEGIYNIDVLENYIFTTNLINKVFKRKLLKSNMFYNGRNFEDAYTLINYLYECSNFYFTKQHFYLYNANLNPNSLTKSIDSTKVIQVLEVLQLLLQNSKFSILKEYKCFDMYCFQFKNLYKNRKIWSKNDVKKIKLNLKQLRKAFKGKAMKLSFKYFSFKRYILYILSFLYL